MVKKKNILIVAGVFAPEPVTSACMDYDLALKLSEVYHVVVLHPKPTRPLGRVFSDNECNETYPFKNITLSSYTYPQSKLLGRFRESMSFGRCVANYIRHHHSEIDLIYNDGWQLFSMYLVSKAANKYKIPYIIPVQDIYPESLLTGHNYPKLLQKLIYNTLYPLDKYYLKHAAAIRTISNEMRDYLANSRKLPKEQFLVVNNWQNDESFTSQVIENKDLSKFEFAYVGSVNVHSNVELIIKAFHKANIPNAILRIIGGGNRKMACVELVKQLGLTNVFFDFVTKNEIPRIQAQADVLILALPEGNGRLCLPSKLTAYMLSERPILASVDLDSTTARLITDASCGLVVESDNMDSLAEGFSKVSSLNRDSLMVLGNNAGSYAKQHLTKEINLSLVVSKITSLLTQG